MAEYLPTVNDLPEAERPRNRLEHYGPGALSTVELLAVLLGTPHQIHDAERLLQTLDGLPGIAQATLHELINLVGKPIETELGESLASLDVLDGADDWQDALLVKAQESVGATIGWVASVRTVELTR